MPPFAWFVNGKLAAIAEVDIRLREFRGVYAECIGYFILVSGLSSHQIAVRKAAAKMRRYQISLSLARLPDNHQTINTIEMCILCAKRNTLLQTT